MATKIGSLFGDVSLRTAKLDKDIAAVGRKMRKMGSGMKAVGRDLTTKLTAPLLGIGAAALVSFGTFTLHLRLQSLSLSFLTLHLRLQLFTLQSQVSFTLL